MMKNNITIILTLSLLALIYSETMANDGARSYAPRDYSIIPPSPEVSSLINLHDVPVDYFHGLPDINR